MGFTTAMRTIHPTQTHFDSSPITGLDTLNNFSTSHKIHILTSQHFGNYYIINFKTKINFFHIVNVAFYGMLNFYASNQNFCTFTLFLYHVKGLMITLFSYTFDINISYKAWLYKLYIIKIKLCILNCRFLIYSLNPYIFKMTST